MKNPARLLACLLIVLLAAACKDKLTEPEFEGRYYLQNNTGISVRVQARDGADFVVLKNSQVSPYSREELLIVPGLSPTNVYASTVFSDIRVYVKSGLKDSTLYQGMRNADWEEGAETEEYKELILNIPN